MRHIKDDSLRVGSTQNSHVLACPCAKCAVSVRQPVAEWLRTKFLEPELTRFDSHLSLIRDSTVVLGNWIFVPQFVYLWNRDSKIYVTRLFWKLNRQFI